MGGQITYKCIGDDPFNSQKRLYEITLTLYRDCGGCDPNDVPCQGWGDPNDPNPATVLGFTPPDGINSSVIVYQGNLLVADITLLCDSNAVSKCTDPTQPYGVQEWIFQGEVSLPKNGGPYTFYHSANARNAVITTINNPAGTSWWIYAVIDPSVCNSSPEFLNPPVSLICSDLPYTYNQNAFDSDGDSLVYTLSPCYELYYDEVNYLSPYSAEYPISSVDTVEVNPFTGEITFTPNAIQVAIMAVKVEEYRNGNKIGEIMRDIQISAVSCANNAPEVSPLTNNGATDTTVLAGTTFCIDFKATDADFLDPSKNLITLSVTSGIIPPATWTYTGPSHILDEGTFCWTPTCDDVRDQPYLVTVLAHDNACPVPGFSYATFEIYVEEPIPDTPDLRCISVVNNNSDLLLQWFYDGNPDHIKGFNVYRATNSPQNFSMIAFINSNIAVSYLDNSPVINPVDSIYYYFLQSVSLCDSLSAPSDTLASIRLQSSFANPFLTLMWNPPTTTQYIPLYRIMRSSGGPFYLFDTTSNLIYVDSITTCTPAYVQHRIDVIHPTGYCTSLSNVVYDTVPGAIPPIAPFICKTEVNLDNSVTVYFNADTNNLTAFTIYRKNTLGGSPVNIGTSTTTSFTDFSIDASQQSYWYEVSKTDTCLIEGALSDQHKTINVEATGLAYSNDLEWNRYIGWIPDVDYYVIYGGTSFPLDSIGFTSDTTFTHNNLPCDERVYYRIKAVRAGNSFCDSVFSDTTSAVPFDPVAPQNPLFCNLSVDSNFTDVNINYFGSTSNDADSIYLYRYNPNALIDEQFNSANLSFTDVGIISSANDQSCYYILSKDSCGNYSIPLDTFCTIDLTAIGDNKRCLLNWNAFTVWTPDLYEIYRGDATPDNFLGSTTLTSYIDSVLPEVCNHLYTYRVKAVRSGIECTISLSDSSKAIPFDAEAPAHPDFCNITVENNIEDIFIEFTGTNENDVETYLLFEVGNSTPIATFGLNGLQFIDLQQISSLADQGCYYLQAIDSCGNAGSNSEIFCSIDLEGNPGLQQNILGWNQFTVWQPDYYNVYGGTSEPLAFISTITDTNFIHSGISCLDNYTYRIEAVRDNAPECKTSFSDTVKVFCSDVVFPNVFTPNNDGDNDFFLPIIAKNVVSIHIDIFNRWGNKIYSSTDPQNLWDGRDFNGNECADATYYYAADVGLLENGEERIIHLTGWVLLIHGK